MTKIATFLIFSTLILASLWGGCWLFSYLHRGPEGFIEAWFWFDVPLGLTMAAVILLGGSGLCGMTEGLDLFDD